MDVKITTECRSCSDKADIDWMYTYCKECDSNLIFRNTMEPILLRALTMSGYSPKDGDYLKGQKEVILHIAESLNLSLEFKLKIKNWKGRDE